MGAMRLYGHKRDESACDRGENRGTSLKQPVSVIFTGRPAAQISSGTAPVATACGDWPHDARGSADGRRGYRARSRQDHNPSRTTRQDADLKMKPVGCRQRAWYWRLSRHLFKITARSSGNMARLTGIPGSIDHGKGLR